jgi:hypothetical protein
MVANNLLTYAQQVLTLYAQLQLLDQQWTDYNVSGTLAQLKTSPINLDGSISTTLDVAPVQTNPINVATYQTLDRPVSLQQLSQVKTVLDGIISYVSGQAVATNAGARAILDAVTGG